MKKNIIFIILFFMFTLNFKKLEARIGCPPLISSITFLLTSGRIYKKYEENLEKNEKKSKLYNLFAAMGEHWIATIFLLDSIYSISVNVFDPEYCEKKRDEFEKKYFPSTLAKENNN